MPATTPEAFRERWPSIAQIPCVTDVLDLLTIEREAARIAREKAVFQKRRADRAEACLRRVAALVEEARTPGSQLFTLHAEALLVELAGTLDAARDEADRG